MSTLFLAFALSLPHMHAVHAERAPQAVEAAIAVANTQGCLVFRQLEDPEERCVRTVRLLLVIALFESGWNPNPPSRPGADNDHGEACGSMQVHKPNLVFGSCADARSSLFHSMREGHAFLTRLTQTCSSLERALGAYATGLCGGAPKTTAWKCGLAGGC